MSINRIINMVINVLIRRVVNSLINAGIRAASRFGRKPREASQNTAQSMPPADNAPLSSVDTRKRAKIAARSIKRL